MKALLVAAILSSLPLAAQARLNVVTMPLVGTTNVISTFSSATVVGDSIVVKTVEGTNECEVPADVIAKTHWSTAQIIQTLESYAASTTEGHLMSCYTESGVVTQIVITDAK
jgi:hypothetical protein